MEEKKPVLVLGGLVVLILILLGGYMVLGRPSQTITPPAVQTTEETETINDNEGNEIAVEIKDFAFSPKEITIKAGSTVRWTNRDVAGHSATADDGTSFDTGIIANGETGTVTFDKPGSYNYHCTPHPNMKATVIVTE